MFTAPRLPPEKRRGRLIRLGTGLGLIATATLLVVANLVLSLAVYFAVDPQVTPVDLYHRTWQAARDNIYDQSALKNWDDWEHKYDHLIETDEDAIRYANEMLSTLEDRYTYLMPAESVDRDRQDADGTYVGIGVTFGGRVDEKGSSLPEDADNGMPVVDRVFHGGPADKAGLAPGDVVTTVDGQATRGSTIEELAALLKGDPGSTVTVAVRRGGRDVLVTLTREKVSIPLVFTRRLPGNVGYIRLESFKQWDTAAEMEAALKELSDCKALVIDVRDNPGGFIHSAIHVSALFLEEGVITREHARIPGSGYLMQEYSVTPSSLVLRVSAGPVEGLPIAVPYRPANLSGDKPVVLLVNGNTASAAELFTAALQDNGRATVVGSRTFGKGVGQWYVPVGNGARLRVTSLRGYTPNGRFIGDGGNTSATGISPDIEVGRFGIPSLGPTGDRQLDRALEYLRGRP